MVPGLRLCLRELHGAHGWLRRPGALRRRGRRSRQEAEHKRQRQNRKAACHHATRFSSPRRLKDAILAAALQPLQQGTGADAIR